MRAETFKTISVIDDALDTELMTYAQINEFTKTRDLALVEPCFKLGQKPVTYHVREVPRRLWSTYVVATNDAHEQRRRAFQCGVTKVENLVQPDGVAITWEPATRNALLGVVYISDEECEARFAPSDWEEIGSVVFDHSFLPRRIESCFRLPPLLDAPLGQRRVRLADPSPNSVSAESSETLLVSTTLQVETATG